MDTVIRDKALELIKASVWNTAVPELNSEQAEAVYQIFKSHTILALPEKVLPQIPDLSDDLRKKWRNDIVHILQTNFKLISVQNSLIELLDSVNIRFAVLKGTSAACYYPDPDLRALGDIDIITVPEDYDEACNLMLSNNCIENSDADDLETGRHRSFLWNVVEVEVHRFFAKPGATNNAEYFDKSILNGINETHRLDSIVNGLTLLDHVNQHLFGGLGFRQVLDWMMFADKCLNEETWQMFFNEADHIGLSKLALVLTNMCEMYLGLCPKFEYEHVDPKLCEQLLDYVVISGNFGHTAEFKNSKYSRALSRIKTPADLYNHLQMRGIENWEYARKHKKLRRFAWIYQSGRLIKKRFTVNSDNKALKMNFNDAKDFSNMFEKLGINQSLDAKVNFNSDEYVKKIAND